MMQKQGKRDAQATFNGQRHQVRNTPSPQLEDPYFNNARGQNNNINLKDFETFEPREDPQDDSSNASSIAIPVQIQRRYEQEMHLMLDDLEMPDQSMNLSSLNNYQWQGKSTRSYLSSLSNNQVGPNGHQSSVESSQAPSARQPLDINSNFTMSNSHSQFGTDEKISRHEDSPDFNRPQENASVTDELTVSKSDIEHVTDYAGGKSYRDNSIDVVQPPFLKNQNRTFADQVIDNQINGIPNQKNPQTSMKKGTVSRLDQNKNINMLGQSKTLDTGVKQYVENKNSLFPYLDSGNTLDEPMLDQSDISDLDLLTRTQISHNLAQIDPNARSRIFIPQLLNDLSQSQITVPGSDPSQLGTKRTNQNNIFKRLVDDASSMNFTPEKDSAGLSSNSLNWQFKSQNTKLAPDNSESTSQLNTDREYEQQQQIQTNPIQQLKDKIKQSNIQKRQASKGRDNELYEALESNNVTQKTLNNNSQLQRTLQDLQSQNQELIDQNRQLAKTCEVYTFQIAELQKVTNQKLSNTNDLLRVRALEAARTEIRELREQLKESEQRVNQLEGNQIELEKQQCSEKQSFQEKIESLELQIEKQKIIIQSHKRDSESKVDKAKIELTKAIENFENANQRADQVSQLADQKLKNLELHLQQSEQMIQARDLENQKQNQKLKKIQNEFTQMESHTHALNQEISQLKLRNSEMEEEVELIRQKNSGNHNLNLINKYGKDQSSSKEFDLELRRQKDKHQQQIAKLSDENYQLQTINREQDTRLQILEQRLLQDQNQDENNKIISQMCQILNVYQNSHSFKSDDLSSFQKLQYITSKLQDLIQQLQAIENSHKNCQEVLFNKDVQLQQLTQKLKDVQIDLQFQIEQTKKAQQAFLQPENNNGVAASTPSNFTKNLLHQKDVDIVNLKEKLEKQEEQLWQSEQEFKACQNSLNQSNQEKHDMQNELTSMRRQKQIAESNVLELKDKLRQEISKQIDLQIDKNKNSLDLDITQGGNKIQQKYEELVSQVMALQLVQDPLLGILQLQKSFNDDHEQAIAHLQEQSTLVKNQMQQIEKQLSIQKQINSEIKLQSEKLTKELKIVQTARENQKSEFNNLELLTQRQAQIITDFENKILVKCENSNLNNFEFLELLDGVIEFTLNRQVTHKNEIQGNEDLREQIKQRIQKLVTYSNKNDLSQILIEGNNPLQEKSGKHEAMIFLQHLGAQINNIDKDIQVDQFSNDYVTSQNNDDLEKANQQIESLKAELSQKQTAFEMLHTQLMQEIQLKTDEFEIENQSLHQNNKQLQQQLERQKQEFDRHINQLTEQHDFRLSEIEIDYQNKIEQDSLVMNSARSQLKSETMDKLNQLKLEEKKLKQEIERLKKSHQEKINQMKLELEQEKAANQIQLQEKLDDEIQQAKLKTKQSVDKAVTTIRSEMLNKISELKNEHARAQAEWQRERSKFEAIKQDAIEDIQQQMLQQQQETVKESKEVIERIWKKKLEAQQIKNDEKLREIDNQLEEVKQNHRDELRKQTKIWQQKIKEAESQKIANDMPRQVNSTMTQVSPQPQFQRKIEEETTPSRRQNDSNQQQQQTAKQSCNCIKQQSEREQQLNLFIEQLKINFEQELERQEALHIDDISQKVRLTIQTFEQLIGLEMEKILVTISFKSKEGSYNSQDDLNKKRNEINLLIKQLYARHKSEHKNLKQSFEIVKQKFSNVLATLKSQLEHKYKNGQQQQTRSTIQIDDTESESNLMSETGDNTTVRSSQQHDQQFSQRISKNGQSNMLVRQSTISTDVNLMNDQSLQTESPKDHEIYYAQIQKRGSELKHYIEYQDQMTFQDQNPMNRLAPQSQNSKGAAVVEVEKVVRDLQMLYESTKMAKFCRVLLGPQPVLNDSDGSQSARSSSQQDSSNVVSQYRDLLNNYFRLIAKLNQASDQVCQDQEVFRLRLLNVNLKQQITQIQKDQSGVVTRGLVQDVIGFYQKQSQVLPRIKTVLEALEQLHFQISKNQFKLNQLADLFTKEGKVNQNIREVVQKCDEFSTMDQFLESSFQNKYLPAEMMSPDETAHLIATVIQKLPNKQLSTSSEDIIKQALQICHDQSTISIPMPPLQKLPKPHHRLQTASTNIGVISNQPNQSTIQTQQTIGGMIRSKSTGIQPHLLNMPRQMTTNNGNLYQTVEPVNRFMSQAEQKQFQGNMGQYATSNVNERYVMSQETGIPSSTILRGVPKGMSQTFSQETNFQIEEGDSVGANNAHHSSLDEELACGQNNVNQLFEKLKGSKFNTLQY